MVFLQFLQAWRAGKDLVFISSQSSADVILVLRSLDPEGEATLENVLVHLQVRCFQFDGPQSEKDTLMIIEAASQHKNFYPVVISILFGTGQIRSKDR